MRDKTTAAVFAFVLGGLGGHKFYLGQVGAGLMYLVFSWTFIPAFVGFFEAIGLLLMDESTFHARFNAGMLPTAAVHQYFPAAPPQQLAQSVVVNVPSTASASNLADALTKLNDLRLAGVLTEEEFSHQKKKLLAS